MLRWLFRLMLAGALGWALAFAGLLFFRHDLIYPFRPGIDAGTVSGVPGAEARRFAASDGTPLIAWIAAPRPGRPVILYFMGNAGALPSAGPRLAEFALRGYGIAALNYRGAGGAPGAPGEAALIGDALTLYDQLDDLLGAPVPAASRVIHGTSLGAAIAARLAAERPAAALILETPFARLCETAEHHYPAFPVCAVLWDERWRSIEAITRVEAPLLILHGDADRIIPAAQGKRLFAAARQPKTLRIYPGGRHNDLRLHGAGIDTLDWLAALGL